MSAAAPARVKPASRPKADKSASKLTKRPSGYLAIDFGIEFYELPRLCSGKAEMCVVMYILSETKSAAMIEVRNNGKTTLRKRSEKESAPRFTRWIKIEEFAEFSYSKPRAIEDALARLCEAKVIEKDPKGPGYRCAIERWSGLPDYTPEPVKLALVDAPEEDDSEGDEDDERIAAEAVPVFKAPLELLPNRAGRARELPKPAVKLQLRSDIRTQIDAVIHQGLLQIRIHGMPSQPEKQGEHKAKHHAGTWSSENGNGKQLNGQPDRNGDSEGFSKFMAAGIRCKMRASEEDWKKAALAWKTLSIEHRLAAVQGLSDHFEAGDTDFLGLPQNFLKNKAWQRGVRKRTDPKERDREEAMSWARELSRKG